MDNSLESPFFMIKILSDTNINLEGGIYQDSDCYNVNELELENFDKNFNFKIKEKKKDN